MKLVEMKCKNCGANLKVDSDVKDVNCQFCGAVFKIDDEVQQYKLDDAEQLGYVLEKGKIRAREEAIQARIDEQNNILQALYHDEKRKRNLIWWIMGWLFFFPIPLTILIWKSKWNQKNKIIATVILWGVLLLIGTLSSNDASDTSMYSVTNNYNINIKFC